MRSVGVRLEMGTDSVGHRVNMQDAQLLLVGIGIKQSDLNDDN